MNLNLIWKDFLKIVNEEEGSRIVETWFKAVALCDWDSQTKTIFLKAPNSFVREWIASHHLGLLKTNLSRLFNEKEVNIVFLDQNKFEVAIRNPETQNPSGSEKQVSTLPLNSQVNSQANSLVSSPSAVKRSLANLKKSHSNINIEYLFDTFVVGPNNSLAYSACQAVASKPGVLYNPLFIYGSSGLGKTHLLHAIANSIKEKNPKLSVLYQSADRFVNEFINAIRFDKISVFENKYKSVDVLLIDDIQFISNKEQTQEAFFYIFNALYESKKQIVFSSDSLPHDITGLAERLRSRINCGLVADIQKPSLELKIAILKKKSEMHKVILDDDVAHYIASLSSSNVRELEGLFIRVLAFSSLMHQEISMEVVSKILPKTIKNSVPKNKVIDLHSVVKLIVKNYGFTLSELKSNKRIKAISLARHIAMYLMKKYCDKSLLDIGIFFNRKDHSTVIHAVEKIEQLMAGDEVFNQEVRMLENKIANS